MAGSGRQRETDEWRGRHCPAPIGSEIFRAPHQHASVARDGHPGSVRGAIDGVIETKRVSYNIQYGTGREGVVDLARIARAVQGADVIAPQEVERFCNGPGCRTSRPCWPNCCPATTAASAGSGFVTVDGIVNGLTEADAVPDPALWVRPARASRRQPGSARHAAPGRKAKAGAAGPAPTRRPLPDRSRRPGCA